MHDFTSIEREVIASNSFIRSKLERKISSFSTSIVIYLHNFFLKIIDFSYYLNMSFENLLSMRKMYFLSHFCFHSHLFNCVNNNRY